VLSLDRQTWLEILAEAWRVEPHEACGVLLAADPEASVDRFLPIRNEAQSSRVFTLDPLQYMRAERFADDNDLEVVGVVHSHTHTAAYPSPTDIAEATKPLVPPMWHWAIVSLAWGYPELRSFRVSVSSGHSRTLPESDLGMDEETVLLKD
jgi:proteasome lid subunit RPN8/RPN11